MTYSHKNLFAEGRESVYDIIIMVEIEAVIRNEYGIHCRPSAVIIREISDYPGSITVISDDGECNPRSMLGLMSLGLACGTSVRIRVEGPDEEDTAASVKTLFERNFDFSRG